MGSGVSDEQSWVSSIRVNQSQRWVYIQQHTNRTNVEL